LWLLEKPSKMVDFLYCTLSMSNNENLFNDTIWDLSLQEIPLLVRSFMWSNMQSTPILSKLDRVLISGLWDFSLPNTMLSSFPITTSDHCPLKIEIATSTPRPQIFRYYNNWKFKPGFKELLTSLWCSSSPQEDASTKIIYKLKILQQKVKVWRRKHCTGQNFFEQC
jgi:hypothetical protein